VANPSAQDVDLDMRILAAVRDCVTCTARDIIGAKDYLCRSRIFAFCCCPADVNPERERLNTVVEDLKELAQHFDVTLELVDWRRVVPTRGPEAAY